MAEKSKVLACVFLANLVAYAWRYGLMGWHSFRLLGWSGATEVALFMASCAAAIVVKRRGVVIALISVMLLVDLVDPIFELMHLD